jgi:rRNA maturation RNase YbeY
VYEDDDGEGVVGSITKETRKIGSLKLDFEELEGMRTELKKDAGEILKLFVEEGAMRERVRGKLREDFPTDLSHVELSIALCDDEYIRKLNNEWRSKDQPTDVLSFPSGGEEEGIAAFGPICVLGDIVISLETAEAQAKEVGHAVKDELRVLLAHGFAHLLGFDHELGDEEEIDMRNLEREIMEALKWDYIKDGGLIDRASSSNDASTSSKIGNNSLVRKIVVLDLDGTTLDQNSVVSDRVANTLLKVLKDESNLIVIATGKARPAAKAALATNALLKDVIIVSDKSPGIFLNGGASYGENGVPIIDDILPIECVRKAFEQKYDEKIGFALTAFTSDDRCLALKSSPFLDDLHERYHEPKSEILASVDDIIKQSRGEVKKMLLIGPNKDSIDGYLKEFSKLFSNKKKKKKNNNNNDNDIEEDGASVTRAVSTMLEVMPKNVNKKRALEQLIKNLVINNDNNKYRLLVIGDGDNDTEMLNFASKASETNSKNVVESFGVAMGNATPSSQAVASFCLKETNAEDGVAVALEKFVLNVD